MARHTLWANSFARAHAQVDNGVKLTTIILPSDVTIATVPGSHHVEGKKHCFRDKTLIR